MKVLIIDDDADLRQVLRAALAEDVDWTVEDRGFEDVDETLTRFRPDMMVLDIVEGEAAGELDQDAGNMWFDRIRETWFCPVVVYSAFPARWSFDRHPFVDTITKGAGTEEQVRARLKAFTSTVEMIQGVHGDFDARVREALRDSVDALRNQIEAVGDASADVSTLPRAVRRLVAARVDEGASGEARLRPWERYVVPPLGNHLLAADLLREEEADWTEAEAFRLVLTPSCDLVPRSDGAADAERILVARCEPLARLGVVELRSGKGVSSKQREKLRPILTGGVDGSRLPLPEFRDHVPLMAADLKRVELLDWEQVRLGGNPGGPLVRGRVFRRIASTDSPFREMVVWAHLSVAGRPGAPETDVDRWLEDISRHVNPGGQR